MSNLSRLAWRCRRGTRELDKLLQGFLQVEFDLLTLEQQQIFEQFLDESDPDLYDWITGKAEPANDQYSFLIQRLQNHYSG